MTGIVIKELFENGKLYNVGDKIKNLSEKDFIRLSGKNRNKTTYIKEYKEDKKNNKEEQTN